MEIKYSSAPISMALREIDKLLLEMFREYGIMIRNFNPMINLDRLCDPSTLSRKSLLDVKFALDKYDTRDNTMTDTSMKSIFIEAIGAFYVYEKFFLIYKDCYQHGFKKVLDRAEKLQKLVEKGKTTPKKVLAIENFQKILEICRHNVEKYPKLLKLKEIVTSYLYGFVDKIIFTNIATAPHLKEVLEKWGLKTEIISGSKGVKKIERLKAKELNCLIFTSIPKVKLEIKRMMIIHYLLPKSKQDRIKKNECNGSIDPEFIFYIYLEHFLDQRLKKVTRDGPQPKRRKKGQGILELW